VLLVRDRDGTLASVPADLTGAADLGGMLAPYIGPQQRSATWTADLADGRKLTLRGWLPQHATAAGQAVDVLLEWELRGEASTPAEGWPEELAAFVHLRHAGDNVTQADGPPQWFGQPAAVVPLGQGQAGESLARLHDWRQLVIPQAGPQDEEWQVVAGVYAPQTGKRLMWQDANGELRDELVLGTLGVMAPQPPDQACALLPATCAAQPQ
jgi:hypothetical protein